MVKTTFGEVESYSPPFALQLVQIALLLAILGTAALLLNLHSWKMGGVTILWPSNGLLLGICLRSPRRKWLWYFVVGFVVDVAVNFILGFNFWPSAYTGLCNMLEVGIAAALMYRTISPKPDLTERRQLRALLLYGVVVAPAIASLLVQLQVGKVHSPFPIAALEHWFMADALGIAVMTPLYLSFTEGEPFSRRSWLEIVGLLTLLGATAALVFWQTTVPLLFLLLPILLLLGFRLRLAGSALGLLIVSIIGGAFTIEGRGPVALIRSGSPAAHDLFLQFFVATSMLMLYVVEMATGERDRLQSNLQASETRFRLLAEVSSDVIVLTDLTGTRRYVSPATTHVLGWDPENLLGGTYHQIVHPDDIGSVKEQFERLRRGEPVEALTYRVRKKDGDYLWMEASLRLYYDTVTKEPIGFVNIVRDVSSRKAAEEELTQAFRLAENLAMIDGLTGVANRRQFDETIDREWRRGMRDGVALSLLMVDVDHFKAYNDLYGHVLGDTCLREIAATGQRVLHRPSDLFARYGGEEFVAVLPHTDSAGAQLVAEQIRNAVEQCGLPHTGNPHAVVTVSIGCATQLPGPDSPITSLLRAADSALYEAKSAGRNCVQVAQTLAAPD
jgi:diguanylate cyclase (GGDEF)-like protein/PAS domain S-box-containing protein